ncbi:MAG TPA: hypothetical protein VM123_20110 [archaeon]|nr:hypothetical protein [archaeon]
MREKKKEDFFPEVLDRLVEVMHHFHCEEPKELERLLRLPEDCILKLFRKRSSKLPVRLVRVLEQAGVRRDFLLHCKGSMLSDTVDSRRLEVMKRHAAHLLEVVCSARQALLSDDGAKKIPLHVTDGQSEPAAIEEELINLLIEALGDRGSRERLLQFIRSEVSNRLESGPGVYL